MKFSPRAMAFSCAGQQLIGVLNLPERPLPRGLLVLPDSRHTRGGLQRQYIRLAQELAARGTPVMRFDARGHGDSEGQRHPPEQMDEDVVAAVRAYEQACPWLRQIVLWAMGDAAPAAARAARAMPCVGGVVLVNPSNRLRSRAYLTRSDLHEQAFWRTLWQSSTAALAGLHPLAQDTRQRLQGFDGALAVLLIDPPPASLEFTRCLQRVRTDLHVRQLDEHESILATATWLTSW